MPCRSASPADSCPDHRPTARDTVLQSGRVTGQGDECERIVSGALRLLTAVDPYGLRPGTVDGTPSDEYVPEAVALARILLEYGNITAQEVEVVWWRLFSESLTARLGSSRTAVLTRDLDDLLRRAHRVTLEEAQASRQVDTPRV